MTVVRSLVLVLSGATFLLMLARVLDLGLLKSKRWPGSFATRPRNQRRGVFALMAMCVAIPLAAEASAAGGAAQLVMLVSSVVIVAATAVVLARTLREGS